MTRVRPTRLGRALFLQLCFAAAQSKGGPDDDEAADDGHDPTRAGEGPFLRPVAKGPGDEAANHRAGDAQGDGVGQAYGLTAGVEGAGDKSDDKAEDDPGNDRA